MSAPPDQTLDPGHQSSAAQQGRIEVENDKEDARGSNDGPADGVVNLLAELENLVICHEDHWCETGNAEQGPATCKADC